MMILFMQCVEMGNRLPTDMNTQLQSIIHSGVTVPSLLHYVEYVNIDNQLLIHVLTGLLDSWMHGRLATT